MIVNRRTGIRVQIILAAYSIIIFLLGMVCFAGFYKMPTLLAAIAAMLLFMFSDVRRIRTPGALLLTTYVLFSGLTILWAISGKFHLREFSKMVLAEVVFLAIVFCGKKKVEFGCQVAAILSGVAALYGIFSVEAASTGLTQRLLGLIPQFGTLDVGFEAGTRMIGILGNPNVMASILAFGVIFSLVLLCGTEKREELALYSFYCGVSAYAFLLCFSMGAMACFIMALAVFLAFSGEVRNAVLVRMLLAAVPTVAFGFLAFPFFDREGAVRILPLLLLAVDVLVIFILESRAADLLAALLEKHRGLAYGMPIFLMVGGMLFVFLACHISGPYTFGMDIRRSLYPDAGEHRLQIESDGDVIVTVASQTRIQTMMHTETELYQGSAANVVFTVPEGSTVCHFTFTADRGTTLHSASVDGKKTIRLNYLLLPDSIANRIQGLWANQNVVQRIVFYGDGLRLFRKHPLLGNGVGSFETGVTSVQDFYYETKYVHNHYIQILVEDGIIGLFCYAGALFWLAALLVKIRKTEMEKAKRLLFSALASALAMAVLHAAFEVSLSSLTFLCMMYAAFGLLVLLYEEPFIREWKSAQKITGPLAEQISQENEKTERLSANMLRVAGVVFTAVYTVTIVCNLYANYLIRRPVHSADAFLHNAEMAAGLDIYERNDIKLSYLYVVVQEQAMAHLSKANEYADQLLLEQSNALPASLTAYYVQTGQYHEAIRAAMAGAVCSSSDPGVWNACALLLRQAFLDGAESVLLTDGRLLIPELGEYARMWRQRNETAMEPLDLDESNVEFFLIVEQLQGKEGDVDQIREILGSYQAGR